MSKPHAESKKQCQFLIGIEEEPKFRVVRQLLGPAGKHVKRIAEATGARLRLRGAGSKFLEGAEQVESTDPLMMCLSAPDDGYAEAVRQVREQLEVVYEEYRQFCSRNKLPRPDLAVQLHEGARSQGAHEGHQSRRR